MVGLALEHHLRIGVGVRHDHDHPLGLALGDEVVQDVVHVADLEPGLVRVGHAVDEVEHREFLLACRVISGRGVHAHHAVDAAGRGMVVAVADLAVRHVLDVLYGRDGAAHVSQRVLEALVGEDEHVVGVSDLLAVHEEAVRVNVGLARGHSDSPDAVCALVHRGGLRQHLAVELDLLGLGGLVAEGHAAVVIVLGRNYSGREHPGHYLGGEALSFASSGLGLCEKRDDEQQSCDKESVCFHDGCVVLVLEKKSH